MRRTSTGLAAACSLLLGGCLAEVHGLTPCDLREGCAGDAVCSSPQGDPCGHQGSFGLCLPRPDVCPEDEAPVCGCDGGTYDDACFAQGGGTDIAYPGPCASPADCRTLGCPGTSRCHACPTATDVVWVCLPAGAVC